MADVDLEWLARSYDLRPMSKAARQRAETSALGLAGRLVDVGGGRGEHAGAWVGPGRSPIVVDPSRAMVAEADMVPGVRVVSARAQHLPFRDGTASLAYFHLSIHYGDWMRALDEAMRVVRPGGRIEIWTMGHEAIKRSSLATWFPRVAEIDLVRFPDPEDLTRYCIERGGLVEVSEVIEPIVRSAGEWMTAVRGRFVSTLQLLDADDMADGLARFASAYPDPSTPYRYDMALTRISTTVQRLR
ncbi:MAG: class I SAM-dependent methyltransferase [Actinomycetota bacterium]